MVDRIEISLHDFLQLLSSNIWQKLNFIRRTKGLRWGEVSITQELVYYCYLFAKTNLVPIKIFESNSEKADGNDLEILMETAKGILRLPCQAKIMHSTSRYRNLNHKVGSTWQIDLLINYAEKIKGYPVYMFYNFQGDRTDEENEAMVGPQFESWGCTLGSAKKLRELYFRDHRFTTPRFSDLHPKVCKPLHVLADSLTHSNFNLFFNENFPDFSSKAVRFYPVEEIIQDINWIDLTPTGLGYIPPELLYPDLLQSGTKNEIFNPKFRILLGLNRPSGSLMYLD